MMEIYCCNCSEFKKCNIVRGSEIYPNRTDLANLFFYQCPCCKNSVGCHKKGNGRLKPLGVIPTKEMRKARIIIHNLIDPLWKKGKISRGKLYKLIAKELGIPEYHTGWTGSIEQCRDVYKVVSKIVKEFN